MRTVAIVGMKGGPGKTTLTLHLAVAAAEFGHVAVLDLDPQQSSAKWGDRRDAAEPVVLAVAPSRLQQELERVAAAGADAVFLDTPPRAGSDNAALAAARAADLVLLPCRPAILDLEAVAATLERVRSVTQAPIVAVLNGCASRGQEAEQASDALSALDVQSVPSGSVSAWRSPGPCSTAEPPRRSRRTVELPMKLHALIARTTRT